MLSITGFIDNAISGIALWERLLIYVAIIAGMAFLARRKHLLSVSGTVTAAVMGLSILLIGGFSAFFMLLFFFISSSLLGKAIGGRNEIEAKGNERDCFQVLANGLPAFIALLLSFMTQHHDAFLIAFACSLAEAEADTFAGDIGFLSHKDPVSILTFTKVPKGLSGGVTLLGIAGSAVGAMLISTLFIGTYYLSLPVFALIASSGVIGALLDSLLGASVQVHYRDSSGCLTEHRYDSEGRENERARGIPFIDNDMVNMISGLFSGTIGAVFAYIIS